MNETSVCLPCVSGILYENNELEGGESMFPKARLPHTPPSLYKRPALFQAKQKRSWGGDMLRFGGVQVYGVNIPMPRRLLSEKSGAQPEPGISDSNCLCNCSHVCVINALLKVAGCFLRHFLCRARAQGDKECLSLSCCLVIVCATHGLVHHCSHPWEFGRLSWGPSFRAC